MWRRFRAAAPKRLAVAEGFQRGAGTLDLGVGNREGEGGGKGWVECGGVGWGRVGWGGVGWDGVG